MNIIIFPKIFEIASMIASLVPKRLTAKEANKNGYYFTLGMRGACFLQGKQRGYHHPIISPATVMSKQPLNLNNKTNIMIV